MTKDIITKDRNITNDTLVVAPIKKILIILIVCTYERCKNSIWVHNWRYFLRLCIYDFNYDLSSVYYT